jgi:urease accessory protein
MKTPRHRLTAAVLLLLPALAQAHPGHGTGESLLAGAVHPLLGPDHLLALIAAGLLAWRMGGRARAGILLAFPALMAAGACAGLAGMEFAITEAMILASIAALAALAIKPPRRLPVMTIALTALFAVFHGHAHGLEAGAGVGGPSFVAGMTAMSAAIMGGALCLAQLARRRFTPSAARPRG